MELLIDNRESIKELIPDPELNTKFVNLNLGDYLYKLNGEDILIIERKTIEDYANSIKDGRYREQKARLLSNYNKNQIIYLIEGDIMENNNSFRYNKVSKDTIISSMINTMMRDGLNVFRTKNDIETVFILQKIYKKFEKQGKSFLKKTYTDTDVITNTLKKKRNLNITKNSCQKLMFNCIPDISINTATRFMNYFVSIQNCIDILQDLSEDKRLDYLQNIPALEGTKFRRISKKSCQNILNFLID